MNRIILTVIVAAVLNLSSVAMAQGLAPIDKTDHVLGQAKAPVTVIEYASLTCPHCARWEAEVFPKVKSDLIDTGKIRYAYRDFPLDGSALKASQLAHCDEQRFYPFLEHLFRTQSTWAQPGIDPQPELEKIARFGGLPPADFDKCMKDDALRNSIVASAKLAQDAGVNSTPTFFFNGKKMSGEMTFDQFASAVKEAGS